MRVNLTGPGRCRLSRPGVPTGDAGSAGAALDARARAALVVIAAVIAATAPAGAQEPRALTHAEATSWLRGYESAWENRDADAAAALFTEDARYYETPYAEPFAGPSDIHDYWSDVTADQRDVDFESSLVAVEDRTGVARWTARFRLASTGEIVELNGVFVLEFDADGRVAVLREWWQAR